MDELRAASNQVELERVQRNLARLQRLGDKHGALASRLKLAIALIWEVGPWIELA